MKMRKILSLMACLCITLSMLPLPAVAQDDILEDYFIIEVEEDLEEAKTPAGALNEFSAAEKLVIDFEVTGESSYEFEAIGENQAETVPYWDDAQITEEGQDESIVEAAFAANGKCGDSIVWELDEAGTLIISGTGDIIEAQWGNYAKDIRKVVIESGITSIVDYCFANCSMLTRVSIPESVTSLGTRCFFNCASLKDIEIPDSVTSMGVGSFDGCIGLSQIHISDNLTKLEAYIFRGCINLGEVNIPSGISSIGDGCFYQCESLASISVPNQVVSLGNDCFYGCSSLGGIILPSQITSLGYECFAGCSALKQIDLPDSLSVIDFGAFYGCTELTSIEIPKGITNLGDHMFAGCTKLSTVNLSDTVTSFGNFCFSGCTSLESIEIPHGVSTLGVYCFSGCGLRNVMIPDSVTSLSDDCFHGCPNLTDIQIPSGVTKLGASCFESCDSLYSISIPDTVTTIESGCFSYCPLTDIFFLGDAPTSILKNAFYRVCAQIHYDANTSGWDALLGQQYGGTLAWGIEHSSGTLGDSVFWSLKDTGELSIWGAGEIPNFKSASEQPWAGQFVGQYFVRNVVISEGITRIGDNSFIYCRGIERVEIPNTVLSIGNYSFSECNSLATISIPESVTSIGNACFSACRSLKTISVPSSVTSIGSGCFGQCTGLESISLPDTILSLGGGFFYGCSSLEEIDIPDSVTKLDSQCFVACTSLKKVVIPESIVFIDSHCFYGCTGLENITIPDSVTFMGESCFDGCTGLKDVYLSSGLRHISNSCFKGCTGLEKITLTENVTFLGESCFEGCTGLKEVHFPAQLGVMMVKCFYGCTSLGSIELPASVSSIGQACFAGCTGLEEMYLPENVRGIPKDCFSGCVGLRSIDMPGVVTIEEAAFFNCKNLLLSNWPSSLEYLGVNSFYGCTSLTDITVAAGVFQISVGCFRGCTSVKQIAFLGNAPTIGATAFTYVTAIVEYDGQLSGWDIAANQNYGGNLTWQVNNIAGKCGDNLTWKLDENGVLTISGIGNMWDYSSDMCAPWYSEREYIGSICVEDGVTSLGNWAFCGCNASEVLVPESVRLLGDRCFANSNLKSITIPGSIESVGAYCFESCKNLENVNIVDGVLELADGAFLECLSLKQVTIPESVITIGSRCFMDSSLVAIDVTEENRYYSSYQGVLFNKEMTQLIQCPQEQKGDYKIPECVTDLAMYAFWGCNKLTKIIIPDSVKSIGEACFLGCESLSEIQIPSGVTELKDAVFSRCTSLTHITIPANVKSIGTQCFFVCYGLKTVDFLGDAPDLSSMRPFEEVVATIHYNPTASGWDTAANQNYGGTLTWQKKQLSTPEITSVVMAVNGVTVKWNAVAGAAQYRVFYKTSSSWKTVANTTATSATITGLTSGTNYTFTVRCLSDDGKSYTSGYDAVGKSITYIAAPIITSVANAANGVTVKWNAVPGAEQYRVFYKNGSGWKSAANTTATSATITGLTVGTNYTFTVRCLSADGKSYTSTYDSTGKSITYTGQLVTPVITSVANAANGVTVKWNAVSGAAQYRVFIKSGTSWKTMANTTSTSATITGLTSGTTYTFTVRCLSADGKSYTSSFEPTGKSITYFAAPKLSSVSAFDTDGAVVQWNAVPGVSSYRVYYKTVGGSWINAGNTTSTGFFVNRLSAGTKYTFTVRCLGADGATLVSSYDSTGLSITR